MVVPASLSISTFCAESETLPSAFSNQGVSPSPIQKTTSASDKALACEGRNAYSCGDASAGIIKSGLLTPSITWLTKECNGAISTATLGPLVVAIDVSGKPKPSSVQANILFRMWILQVFMAI